MKKTSGPRILLFDVETAPIVSYHWGLFDQNIGLNQIKSDWHLLSFAAKWADNDKIIYHDQRNAKNIEDDKALLQKLWKLLDEADIVIGQNSKAFDHKKVNARFILNGMKPPSSFKIIDTKKIASKHFGFTSNKLQYLTDKLCKKFKKLKPKKFGGFDLWVECLKGNKTAWNQMRDYNIMDVLSLEELYHVLQPWDSSINFNVYTDELDRVCACGSKEFHKIGFGFTSAGKFQRYRCNECGAEHRSKVNLLSPEKRKSLRS